MPAVAPLEELQKVKKALTAVQKKHPEAYKDIVTEIVANKQIGYKNICKLLQGVTPEDLKKVKEK